MASTSSSDLLPSPYDTLAVALSDRELRDAAFEVFVAGCLTDEPPDLVRMNPRNLSVGPSRTKEALGISSSKNGRGSPGPKSSRRRPKTKEELMKEQMGISRDMDFLVRHALCMIDLPKAGPSPKIKSTVLPFVLLHSLRSFDFSNLEEYEAWRIRHLKVLEAGLILHPLIPLDVSDDVSQRFLQLITEAKNGPLEDESRNVLRSTVTTLASRSSNESASDVCHWADGYPLNLHLYQMLLQACFDNSGDGSIIDEIDEVLELTNKSWCILGINQALHNLCFFWTLVQQFVTTGQADSDLLVAANTQLAMVATDAKTTKDSLYSKILSCTLSSVMGWTERRLSCYHDTFDWTNIELMKIIVSLGVSIAIVEEDISDVSKKREETEVARDRVDAYIRSSIRTAFDQRMEQLSRDSSNPWLALATLTKDSVHLADKEKEMFSPTLKKWHPLAAGVAVAALHSCYGNGLKRMISGATKLTSEITLVLEAADNLEKDLVLRITAEGFLENEDGVNSLIQEMRPYESIIPDLAGAWIEKRVDTIKELIDQNMEQEVQDPSANMEDCAIEVLRRVNATIDSFFHLPIPMYPAMLTDLVMGLDKGLQYYISKMKSNCSTRSSLAPPLPALTRCRVGFQFWKRKGKSPDSSKRRLQVGGSTSGDNSVGLPQLCRRAIAVNHIKIELENLEKKMRTGLENVDASRADVASGLNISFELSTEAVFQEGIVQICETAAYKAIFHDLSHLLWHSLYTGDIASSRIDPFVRELDTTLATVAGTVQQHPTVRNIVITAFMKASFDGFLLVLLAGGPKRAFSRQDSQIIEEDFRSLRDLYLRGGADDDGGGVPEELVEETERQVKDVLPLFSMESDDLIRLLKDMITTGHGRAPKSPLPLPPTSQWSWSSHDADTVLRVLCHRREKVATKFLKKTYHLPKNM